MDEFERAQENTSEQMKNEKPVTTLPRSMFMNSGATSPRSDSMVKINQ